MRACKTGERLLRLAPRQGCPCMVTALGRSCHVSLWEVGVAWNSVLFSQLLVRFNLFQNKSYFEKEKISCTV